MQHVGHQTGGGLGEVGVRSGAGKTTSELLKDIAGNVQEIIRSEFRLARTETIEQAGKAWEGARLLIAGAVMGIFALGFVLATIALLFARVMPAWAAVGLTATIVGITAAVMISSGRTRMKQVHIKPEKTVESVKENVQWMKDQTRS